MKVYTTFRALYDALWKHADEIHHIKVTKFHMAVSEHSGNVKSVHFIIKADITPNERYYSHNVAEFYVRVNTLMHAIDILDMLKVKFGDVMQL